MQFHACLQLHPHRHLIAASRVLGLPLSTKLAKRDLCQQIADHLSRPNLLSALLAQLGNPEIAALQSLAARADPMPVLSFQRHYGPIRSYQPWRSDNPIRPWSDPLSPAEALYYRGLIAIQSPSSHPAILLPDELRSRFQPAPPGPQTAPLPQPSPSLLFDLALFLAYLQRCSVQPRHGRWLSPAHCQALGSCLLPPLPGPALRSELQAPRLAFIHYLAESLDLLHLTGDLLKPTPLAHAWLAQPPARQLRAAWQAWLDPSEANTARWRRFRLPGHTLRDPVGFARNLSALLARQAAAAQTALSHPDWTALADLLPWWEKDQAGSLQDLLASLRAGPLAAFQVLADPSSDLAQGWRLTAQGCWLLLDAEAAASAEAPPQPLHLSPSLTIALEKGSSPPALLALSPWAELQPGPILRFTERSIAAALDDGATLPDLIALLTRHLNGSPSAGRGPGMDGQGPGLDGQVEILRGWAERHAPLTLQPALLLRSPSPDQMDRLWQDRKIRPHLGRRLAPDLAVVQTPQVQRLIAALQRQDYPLRSPASQAAPFPACQPAADAYWQALALTLYDHLARRLDIGLPPPGVVQEKALAALDGGQRAALEQVAGQALQALEQALEGPPPLPVGQSCQEIEACIQRALAGEQRLRLRYYSPWQGEISQRTVTPLQLEWRGDHRYLLAHCHQAQAQRSFRLDRILEIQIETPP